MRREENIINELVDILRCEVPGEIELLNLTSEFICLGYGVANGDIQKIKLEQILDSNIPENILGQAYEELEYRIPLLKDVFIKQGYSSLNTETLKKVVALLRGSNFEQIEYRNAANYLFQMGIGRLGKVDGIIDAPIAIKQLIVSLFDQYEGTVYDATSGLGGNLLEYISKSQEPDNLEVYGQEMNYELCRLSKMRFYINNILKTNLVCQNSLVDPVMDTETSSVRKFDSVLMIPPFGMSWKQNEEIIRHDIYSRYMYGMPSVSNADWLFMSLAVNALNESGKAVVVTTLGSLFRGGSEEKIRQKIINFDYIESVIQLPAALFENTGIPVVIVVFNKVKPKNMKNKIQFINASDMYESAKRARKTLSDLQVKEIVTLYKTKNEVDEVSILIPTNEIEEANLVPSKYVQSLVFDSASLGKVRIHTERINFTNKLGDIGSFYRGINITSKYVQAMHGNYKVVNYADVKDGQLDMDSVQTYGIKNNARVEAYRVQEGDLIISNKGVTKVCVIPKHEGDMLISQNFVGIRLNKEFNAEYVKEYLESPLGEFLLEKQKTGTAIKMISMKDLQEIPLVINHKSNQNRIMEEYVNREQELKEELLSIQEKLSSLKTELYDKMEISNIVESV